MQFLVDVRSNAGVANRGTAFLLCGIAGGLWRKNSPVSNRFRLFNERGEALVLLMLWTVPPTVLYSWSCRLDCRVKHLEQSFSTALLACTSNVVFLSFPEQGGLHCSRTYAKGVHWECFFPSVIVEIQYIGP